MSIKNAKEMLFSRKVFIYKVIYKYKMTQLRRDFIVCKTLLSFVDDCF